MLWFSIHHKNNFPVMYSYWHQLKMAHEGGSVRPGHPLSPSQHRSAGPHMTETHRRPESQEAPALSDRGCRSSA